MHDAFPSTIYTETPEQAETTRRAPFGRRHISAQLKLRQRELDHEGTPAAELSRRAIAEGSIDRLVPAGMPVLSPVLTTVQSLLRRLSERTGAMNTTTNVRTARSGIFRRRALQRHA
jgi:hypothetical protein